MCSFQNQDASLLPETLVSMDQVSNWIIYLWKRSECASLTLDVL